MKLDIFSGKTTTDVQTFPQLEKEIEQTKCPDLDIRKEMEPFDKRLKVMNSMWEHTRWINNERLPIKIRESVPKRKSRMPSEKGINIVINRSYRFRLMAK